MANYFSRTGLLGGFGEDELRPLDRHSLSSSNDAHDDKPDARPGTLSVGAASLDADNDTRNAIGIGLNQGVLVLSQGRDSAEPDNALQDAGADENARVSDGMGSGPLEERVAPETGALNAKGAGKAINGVEAIRTAPWSADAQPNPAPGNNTGTDDAAPRSAARNTKTEGGDANGRKTIVQTVPEEPVDQTVSSNEPLILAKGVSAEANGPSSAIPGTSFAPPGPLAAATTFTVSTTSDTGDDATVTGDLAAETADGGGLSLREAIILANAAAGADTITFASGAGQAFENGGTITLSGTELALTSAITIDGDVDGDNAADVTIDANSASRVMSINAAGEQVNLSSLTITGGQAALEQSGGGLYITDGTVSLTYSTVSGNRAGNGSNGSAGVYDPFYAGPGGTGGDGGDGGGIFVAGGAVTITSSTLSSNHAGTGGDGGTGGDSTGPAALNGYGGVGGQGGNGGGGGGIALDSGASLSLSNATLTNNATGPGGDGGAGGNGDSGGDGGHGGNGGPGGAVFASSGALVVINNTTVTVNMTGAAGAGGPGRYGVNETGFDGNAGAQGQGGGLYHTGAAVDAVLTNSLVLGNTATAGTENLNAPNWTIGTSLTSGDPATVFQTSTLADNGGPVQTVALLNSATNPALDAGDDATAPATDARGNARSDLDSIANNGANISDLGAFELEAPSLIVTTIADVVDPTDLVTSLREAIAFANDPTANGGTGDADNDGNANDTITFAAGVGEAFESGGTIVLSGTELALTSSITIDGDVNGDNTVGVTIDANSASRVMSINAAGEQVNLSSLTITGGQAALEQSGGGLYITDGTVSLTYSTVSGNRAGNGSNGSAGASSGVNYAPAGYGGTGGDGGDGGGIFVAGGALVIANSTLASNHSGTGGDGGIGGDSVGFYGYGGLGGQGGNGGRGGGIAVDAGASLSVSNTTLTDNAAGPGGDGGDGGNGDNGGSGGNGGNGGLGGAVFASAGALVAIDNATVAVNQTGAGGDGGQGRDGSLPYGAVNGVNGLAGAQGQGGGLYHGGSAGAATLANSLVLGNTATAGTENLNSPNWTISTSLTSGDPATVFQNSTLADNGGPVQTVALLNSATNPALDAGDDATAPATDARGVVRPIDVPGVANNGANASDLGAVELITSLVVDNAVDEDDGDFSSGDLSLREALALIGSGGTVSFDPTVFTGGAASVIRLALGQIQISSDVTIDGTTGTDVLITGDVDDDDAVLAGTDITDAATNANTMDNVQVFDIAAGTTTLRGLTITGGFNAGSGPAGAAGGIKVESGAALTVETSTVAGNRAQDGGGIYNAGTLVVSGSTISGNRADFNGAGIDNLNGSVLTLVNTTIAGNTAVNTGGGIDNQGIATITNSTISGNSAASGGGIGTYIATTTLYNSIVLGNNGFGPEFTPYGTAPIVNNSIITGDPTTIFAQTTPLGPYQAGVLADNGGPVQTIALLNDVSNPALDAGDDGVAPATDARGIARFDFPTVANNGVNISDLGALELLPDTPSLVVTTTLDLVADDGETSLREALAFANDPTANGGTGDADNDGNANDTITFASGVGDAFEFGGTIDLNGTELVITSDVTIDGVLTDPTRQVIVDGQASSRVFNVTAGTATIDRLEITNGDAGLNKGGGINVASGAALALTNSTVSNNDAGQGGGIYNFGSATVVSSTISGNTASNGGGLYNFGTDLTVTNTTVANNSATFNGGGIQGFAPTYVTNATISGNSAGNPTAGGGVYIFGTLTIDNTIVLGNTANGAVSEVATAYTGSNNLIGGTAANVFDQVAMVNGVDAGVLADNGGPVETIALKASLTNPAIDQGASALPPDTFDLDNDGNTTEDIPFDARGFARDVEIPGVGSTPDVGAFETQIIATPGPDILLGTNGADVQQGLGGNDLFVSSAGADSIDGGAGINDTVDYSNSSARVTVFLNGFGGISGDAQGDTLTNVENLIGTNANDFLGGSAGSNSLAGLDSQDILDGQDGGVADTLNGGDGIDTAYYFGAIGNQVLDMSDHTNLANNQGEHVNDTWISIEGFFGANGFTNDLTGDNVANYLLGGSLGDTISGLDGADHLYGRGGNDTLIGGNGNDVLLAGEGTDTVTGGADLDIFYILNGNETDIITDWSEAEDFFFFYQVTGVSSYGDLSFTDIGSDVRISSATNTTFEIIVQNRELTDLDDQTHFVFG